MRWEGRSTESDDSPGDAIDRQEFFCIMGAFPTGVAIVTSVDINGIPRGLSSNAICSVSADPTLLLVCVDSTSRTLPAMQRSGAFTINFLLERRDDLCRRFASKIEDKFAGVRWEPGRNGMPILHEDVLAYAECTIEQEIEAGDHVIVVGRVTAGREPDGDEMPLVYFRRGFGC